MTNRRPWIAVLLLALAAPLWARPLVVDTFEHEKPENNLKGPTGCWGDTTDKSISATAEFDDTVRLWDEGNSLRLDYDIESSRENVYVPSNYSVQNPAQIRNDVYNGYFSAFEPKDVTPYKYLVLWVKGDPEKGYTRSFKLELKDAQGGVAGVQIEGITDKWRKFSVALDRFKEIKDWTKIKEYTVVFGPTVTTRKAGTIYIDDVYFAATPDEKIRLRERRYDAVRAAHSPEIDGSLDEWPGERYFDMSDAGNEFVESGARQNVKDASAWFQLAWDDQYLYIAVDAQDNEVLNGQSVMDIWKDDCVEVYLDPLGEGFLWEDPRVFQLGFAPTSAAGTPAKWAWFQRREPTGDEVRYAVRKYKDGYQMEAAIAWTFLGVSPDPARPMGLSVAVHDRDKHDKSEECKLNWSFEAAEGSHIKLGKLILQ